MIIMMLPQQDEGDIGHILGPEVTRVMGINMITGHIGRDLGVDPLVEYVNAVDLNLLVDGGDHHQGLDNTLVSGQGTADQIQEQDIDNTKAPPCTHDIVIEVDHVQGH